MNILQTTSFVLLITFGLAHAKCKNRIAFKLIDTNRDDNVERDELETALQKCGKPCEEKGLRADDLMAKYQDKNGQVTCKRLDKAVRELDLMPLIMSQNMTITNTNTGGGRIKDMDMMDHEHRENEEPK